MSGFFGLGGAGEDGRGGAAGNEGQNVNLGADFLQGGALAGVERFDGVVAAFGVESGVDGADDVRDAQRVEDDDVVHGAERGHDAGAVLLAIDGAGWAFQFADGAVGIQRDGECVAEGASALEVIDVAGVEEIEAAVGQDEAATLGVEASGFASEIVERKNGGHCGRRFGREVTQVQRKNRSRWRVRAGILRENDFSAMRPITKILLLVVVAFFVYLLWPRTPNLKGFDPGAMADLQVQAWQADKLGKGLDAMMARYKIFASQYHFSPVAAFQIARAQGNAVKEIASAKQPNGDAADENRALSALTEKYTVWKTQTHADFDPDALAREEYAWRALEIDGAKTEEIAAPMTRIFAAIYGGVPGDFVDVGTDLASARGMIFGQQAPTDGSDPVRAAKETAKEGYSLLKEIAAAPAPNVAVQ